MSLRSEIVAADDRPWDRPGAVRRDCEAHRGGLLLALGDASLLLGVLSLPLGFLALMGLGLGTAAWALASRDLRRMRTRVMDPGGLADTVLGRARARAGLTLSIYAAALWTCFLVLVS
jgi:hypothetical protein